MDYLSLFTPFLTLVAIFVPLMLAEQWVHQHAFGLGYLITKNKASATRAFYIFFFPGIFIHEFVQYLVAGALSVPIKKGFHWPQQQENGTLRLDFVVVERDKTDSLRAAIVAAAPLIIMMVIISQISTNILSFDDLLTAWGKNDISVLWKEFRELFGAGDFLVWFYLLFSIANSMIPKRADAHGWPIILGVLAVIIVIMVIIGLDEVLVETLSGSVKHTLELVNTALLLTLLMDISVIVVLGLIEQGLARVRGFKMEYGDPNAAKSRSAAVQKREPGSDLPYPKGETLPSIYTFLLPVPDPSDKVPKPKPSFAATPEPDRPQITVRPSALASRSPLAEKAEEKPVDVPRQFGTRPTPDRSSSPPSNRPEIPRREQPSDEPSRERQFGTRPTPDRPSSPPSNRPEIPRREQPSDEPSRERQFGTRPIPDRPSSVPSNRITGERPTFQRSGRLEEETQKPEITDKPARPTGTHSAVEKPTFQRNFTPAPRRTSPFVLDEDTANELDQELEYVDFDEDNPSSDED